MALPKLLQKLFQNGGAGDKLNPEIVPEIKKLMLGNHVLELQEDGSLKLDENLVITSAGGTVDGMLTMGGDVIKNKNVTSWLAIFGGTNFENGAGLELCGGSREHSTGEFFLSARIDNNNVYKLNGQPNGKLLWGDKRVITEDTPLAPDYDSGVTVSSSGLTAPSAGVVILICTGNPKGGSYIIVNGAQRSVFNYSDASVDRTNFVWVKKGDVINYTAVGTYKDCVFYPLKAGV